MVSSSADCWFSSKYAEGSCDSGVPFYGMYSTQLHIGLFAFHLPTLFGGILLEGCIPLGASFLDSFLHFQ